MKSLILSPALGAAWFFLYGYCEIPAANYLPALRSIGGTFTKVYLFWQQLEPEKNRFDWSALDAFANQLSSPEEGLVSLFSSSQWATEKPSAMLPPSPAKDLGDYYEFVFQTVKRIAGRVRFWQNDSEPNNPIYWAGSAGQFVEHLRVFYRAVKDADPEAVVVVGGHDGLFNPPGMTPLPGQRVAPFPQQEASLKFFDEVIREGCAFFDVFDLRLYGDVYTIPARVAYFQNALREAGSSAPIICTEYGGPNFFEFPENRQYLPLINAWSQAIENDRSATAAKGGDLSADSISALYTKMNELAAPTRMFLQGCEPELEARYHRIQSRSLVMRNLFALAAGVQRTLYWDLLYAHGARDDLMTLMYGKIGLLEPISPSVAALDTKNAVNSVGLQAGPQFKRKPSADVFARLTSTLAGVTAVRRHVIAEQPNQFVFEVERTGRPRLCIFWERRNLFDGETLPPTPFSWPWIGQHAPSAVNLFGQSVAVDVSTSALHIPLSIDPLFVEDIAIVPTAN